MNEEMRKEFEDFWANYCNEKGVNYNLARLINGSGMFSVCWMMATNTPGYC